MADSTERCSCCQASGVEASGSVDGAQQAAGGLLDGASEAGRSAAEQLSSSFSSAQDAAHPLTAGREGAPS